MALIYFLDGSDEPAAAGDSYAAVTDIDAGFLGLPCFLTWSSMTTEQKENIIKAVTLQIDQVVPRGYYVDSAQPLIFPRTGLADDYDARSVEFFGLPALKKSLIQAVAVQIEANIQKGSISQLSISQGRRSYTDKHFNLHPFARNVISRWIN